jgi:hypothetical protein
VRESIDEYPCAPCAHQLKCFQSKTCEALILLVPSPAPSGTLKLPRMRNISYIVSGASGVFRALPVDGYVPNLNRSLASQAVANQSALALVDVNSFWVQGFFQETAIRYIRAGDRATVTLMAYPGTTHRRSRRQPRLGGPHNEVSTGYELLPTVTPTFEWIRLAQGVPAFRRTRVEIFSIWTLNPTA